MGGTRSMAANRNVYKILIGKHKRGKKKRERKNNGKTYMWMKDIKMDERMCTGFICLRIGTDCGFL
jgi:hypothetical protein